jgi:hypothetical protein
MLCRIDATFLRRHFINASQFVANEASLMFWGYQLVEAPMRDS